MRQKYEMSQEQLDVILDACKPVIGIMVGICLPSTPQENANRAWAELGETMGFDSMTVKPGSSDRFFSAEPVSPCPRCGKPTPGVDIIEGYCRACHDYNLEYDRWLSLTPEQQDLEISNAPTKP